MNENEILNDPLTIFDRDTDWYHEGLPAGIVPRTADDVLVAAKLSPLTRKLMERYYAKQARKKKPRKPTKARGRYHWKRKEATAKRRAAARWAENPLGCLINGKGCWAISREEWDTHIAPFWGKYDPADLRIKRRWGYGTALLPYKIHDISLVHVKAGVLFDGDALKLWELSGGSSLRDSLDAVSS